jgi:hypothetical protein
VKESGGKRENIPQFDPGRTIVAGRIQSLTPPGSFIARTSVYRRLGFFGAGRFTALRAGAFFLRLLWMQALPILSPVRK